MSNKLVWKGFDEKDMWFAVHPTFQPVVYVNATWKFNDEERDGQVAVKPDEKKKNSVLITFPSEGNWFVPMDTKLTQLCDQAKGYEEKLDEAFKNNVTGEGPWQYMGVNFEDLDILTAAVAFFTLDLDRFSTKKSVTDIKEEKERVAKSQD